MAWTRSDKIAASALLLAGGTSVYQLFFDRSEYHLQDYIDKNLAGRAIIQAVEDVIHARQRAMIAVDGNYYDPYWAMQQTVEQLNTDARKADPVIEAVGKFSGTLQTNITNFKEERTLTALEELERQVDKSVACFTTIASVRRKVNQEQLHNFKAAIAKACAGANMPPSLDALKNAEAAALSAMEAERKEA